MDRVRSIEFELSHSDHVLYSSVPSCTYADERSHAGIFQSDLLVLGGLDAVGCTAYGPDSISASLSWLSPH